MSGAIVTRADQLQPGDEMLHAGRWQLVARATHDVVTDGRLVTLGSSKTVYVLPVDDLVCLRSKAPVAQPASQSEPRTADQYSCETGWQPQPTLLETIKAKWADWLGDEDNHVDMFSAFLDGLAEPDDKDKQTAERAQTRIAEALLDERAYIAAHVSGLASREVLRSESAKASPRISMQCDHAATVLQEVLDFLQPPKPTTAEVIRDAIHRAYEVDAADDETATDYVLHALRDAGLVAE